MPTYLTVATVGITAMKWTEFALNAVEQPMKGNVFMAVITAVLNAKHVVRRLATEVVKIKEKNNDDE